MRPDTRPIEDPAERPKILLAKLGASTHVMAYKMPLGGASTASVHSLSIQHDQPITDRGRQNNVGAKQRLR